MINLNMNALGVGDDTSSQAYGAELFAWDAQGLQFIKLDENTADSLASGDLSAEFETTYRTHSDHVYLLIKSRYKTGTNYDSAVDLNFYQDMFSMEVPYQNIVK